MRERRNALSSEGYSTPFCSKMPLGEKKVVLCRILTVVFHGIVIEVTVTVAEVERTHQRAVVVLHDLRGFVFENRILEIVERSHLT